MSLQPGGAPPAGRFAGRVECPDHPILAIAGLQFGLTVRVANLAPAGWPRPAGEGLNLSYHWIDGEGRTLVHDGLRSPAAPGLGTAGASSEGWLVVQAPATPGRFRLVVTLVLESVAWLENEGLAPAVLDLDVLAIGDALPARSGVLIAGGAGFRNAGDEALLRACVERTLAAAPGRPIVVCANDPLVAAETLAGLPVALCPSLRVAAFRNDAHYAAGDAVFMQRWQRLAHRVAALPAAPSNATWAELTDFASVHELSALGAVLAACGTLVVHGGGILTSATRSRLWELALLARWGRHVGSDIVLRSQQFGPYERADETIVRELLDGCRLACARDRGASRRELARIGVHCPVHESIDDAFSLEAGAASVGVDALRRFGLRPRAYACIAVRHNASVGADAPLLPALAALADQALDAGLAVLLLPMGPFDMPALRQLAGTMRGRATLAADLRWREVMALAEHSRVTIATPHHALIFALRGGARIVSLVSGAYYDFKNRGSLSMFGLGDRVHGLDAEGCSPAAQAQLGLALDAAAAHFEPPAPPACAAAWELAFAQALVVPESAASATRTA